MGILAVYDTVGIQNYIFASNKLAENVGGSKLVKDIFEKLLKEAILDWRRDKTLSPEPKEAIASVTESTLLDWRCGKTLSPEPEAEIIYQGGGNAFVAFGAEPIFQAVTEKFLVSAHKSAPGVGIAVAAVKTDFEDTYKSDFDLLNKRLAAVKGGFITPVFAGNQPITKQSVRTGLPVSSIEDGEYLSTSQAKKRKRYAFYVNEERGNDIKDFDSLTPDKGSDSLIAIVHADGNNMGSRIKAFMEQFKTYAEAVPAIRQLSVKIDNCYKAARERTIKAFVSAYKKYIAEQMEKFPSKNFSDKTPILELIGDGDDTTLVIGGKFAIDFAARLLREIEATPEEDRPFADTVPTACAGVVLFHSHYPFSEAYKLTEELCSSAKKPSRKAEGSYIDFHLHQSGSVSGLHQLRERQYKIDGKSLLRRPWRVSGSEANEQPNFRWFEANVPIIAQLPRNKTKAIRNAIGE